MKEHLAIFGGTFNPIHIGHLHIMDRLVEHCGYGRILLIPAHVPAHKCPDQNTDPEIRLEMLRQLKIEYATVEDCEIRRGGISYSIDTVRYVIEHYKVAEKPGLLIGDDLIEGFTTWKRVADLVPQVDLIIAHRQTPEKLPFRYPHTYLDNRIVDIDSTTIRRRIRSGISVKGLVPERVLSYIQKMALYR